jgi:putative chitinase
MFPGRVGDTATVEAGLPGLLEQMAVAEIDTPRRVAAFLATLAHESAFQYNVKQHGSTAVFAGRGYIQLTGVKNYQTAGDRLGVDLVANPDLALSLAWSAKIARWYWTVARRINPLADALQMGKVNAAIGYPIGDGTEDRRRCTSFKIALRYLTGTVPDGISDAR